MTKKASKNGSAVEPAASGEPRRAPSADEIAAFKVAAERHAERTKRVQVKMVETAPGAFSADAPHSDIDSHYYQSLDAVGTTSPAFYSYITTAMANVTPDGGGVTSEQKLNAALAFMDGYKPNNEVEAALLAQMFATHSMGMNMLETSKKCEMLCQMEAFGNLSVKLMRTFTAQVEALAKLRRGGEQTVRVEHVHVHEGGQAIVGVVNQGGASGKGSDQPYGPDVAAALSPSLLGHDPAGFGVPIPSNAERPVPAPRRRQPRRSKGE